MLWCPIGQYFLNQAFQVHHLCGLHAPFCPVQASSAFSSVNCSGPLCLLWAGFVPCIVNVQIWGCCALVVWSCQHSEQMFALSPFAGSSVTLTLRMLSLNWTPKRLLVVVRADCQTRCLPQPICWDCSSSNMQSSLPALSPENILLVLQGWKSDQIPDPNLSATDAVIQTSGFPCWPLKHFYWRMRPAVRSDIFLHFLGLQLKLCVWLFSPLPWARVTLKWHQFLPGLLAGYKVTGATLDRHLLSGANRMGNPQENVGMGHVVLIT